MEGRIGNNLKVTHTSRQTHANAYMSVCSVILHGAPRRSKSDGHSNSGACQRKVPQPLKDEPAAVARESSMRTRPKSPILAHPQSSMRTLFC